MFCPCCRISEGTSSDLWKTLICAWPNILVIWKAFRNQAKFVNQKTRELLSEIHRSRFGLNTSFGVSHNLLSGLHWGKTYNISSSRHFISATFRIWWKYAIYEKQILLVFIISRLVNFLEICRGKMSLHYKCAECLYHWGF